MKRGAIFLDRDGVLTVRPGLTWKKSQIKIAHGAKLLRHFNKRRMPIVVVTNQSVVARGLVSEKGVRELHRFTQQKLERLGVSVDKFYFCPHHPEATLQRYRRRCACRKPGTALFRKAARDLGIDLRKSFMVGDMTPDILAGKRLNMKTVLLRAGHGGRDGKYNVKADFRARDLAGALKIIQKHVG